MGTTISPRLDTALRMWAAANGRTPPWRSRTDTYSLAVAEILLQKTRAAAVQPIWERLIASYPSVADMADSRLEDVRNIVAPIGLGTQRAQRLQATARAIRTGDARLPGIGSYGQAVIDMSQGLEPRSAPVDGNVARVLSRVTGMRWAKGEPRKKQGIRAAALEMLGGPAPILTLYALVDLGATLCVPRTPKCDSCPLRSVCRGRSA